MRAKPLKNTWVSGAAMAKASAKTVTRKAISDGGTSRPSDICQVNAITDRLDVPTMK